MTDPILQKLNPIINNFLLLSSSKLNVNAATDQLPRPSQSPYPKSNHPAPPPQSQGSQTVEWLPKEANFQAPGERGGKKLRFSGREASATQTPPPHPADISTLLTPWAGLSVGRHGEAAGRGDLREEQEVRSAGLRGESRDQKGVSDRGERGRGAARPS